MDGTKKEVRLPFLPISYFAVLLATGHHIPPIMEEEEGEDEEGEYDHDTTVASQKTDAFPGKTILLAITVNMLQSIVHTFTQK